MLSSNIALSKMHLEFLANPALALSNPEYKNQPDENGITLLSLIAGLGATELIPYAVALGYDLNLEGVFCQVIDGQFLGVEITSTPIHIAMLEEHYETANKLKQYGADVNFHLGLKPERWGWSAKRSCQRFFSNNSQRRGNRNKRWLYR